MPLTVALNLITLLEKCKCKLCQDELKRLKKKYQLDEYEVQKDNRAEGESHRERSKREDINYKKALINNPYIKESRECFENDDAVL